MVTGCTGGDDGNRPIVEGNIAPKLLVKSRYKLADGKPFDNPTIHKHSPNDMPKMTFKINVGDIPENEIEDYVRKVAKKLKATVNSPMPDFDCGIYNIPNCFAASAITTTYIPNANYMHVIPNSHYWGNLDQLLTYLGYIQISGNQWYTAWGAEVEQLIIGLENTIKNGYYLKNFKGKETGDLVPFYYESIENMISDIKEVNISPEYPANGFLKDFIKTIQYTKSMGYDLTNGLKMERKEVYKRLDGERDYQDKTWVARRTLEGTPDEEKPVAEWINYIEHHLAKAKEKVYYLDTQAALAEIRKVTALGVRTMEIHGCPPRGGTPVIGGEKPSCDCDCKK